MKEVYQIYDYKAETYMFFGIYNSEQDAVKHLLRFIGEAGDTSVYYLFPEDYGLKRTAEYDEESGCFFQHKESPDGRDYRTIPFVNMPISDIFNKITENEVKKSIEILQEEVNSLNSRMSIAVNTINNLAKTCKVLTENQKKPSKKWSLFGREQ